MGDQPVFVGTRSIQEQGDSLTITIPRRSLREQLGTEPEEAIGSNVLVSLNDSGRMIVDLGPIIEANR